MTQAIRTSIVAAVVVAFGFAAVPAFSGAMDGKPTGMLKGLSWES